MTDLLVTRHSRYPDAERYELSEHQLIGPKLFSIHDFEINQWSAEDCYRLICWSSRESISVDRRLKLGLMLKYLGGICSRIAMQLVIMN